MNQFNRRDWLRTAGLSSGLILLSGLDTTAAEHYNIDPDVNGPIKLNANENPYSPSINIQKVLTDNFDLTCRYPFRILSEI